jgi:hypothetical protein
MTTKQRAEAEGRKAYAAVVTTAPAWEPFAAMYARATAAYRDTYAATFTRATRQARRLASLEVEGAIR